MTLLLIGLALVVAAGAVVGAGRTARSAHLSLLITGCGLGIAAAARVLVTSAPIALTLRASVPGGDWQLGVDALSATFLIVILSVGALCAVFGVDDTAHDRSATLVRIAFPVLVASIALVVVAQCVVVFLGAWEVMAISSYLLIVAHHEDATVRRAGLIYLVATHTATLALYAMFAIWAAHAADWSFAALGAVSFALGPASVAAILLLALVGFGFKAGAVPLHIWLPPAHAAAPSHVSALMSGIVIKTGIYGLLRVLVLMGVAPAWWGWLVFAIGVTSGVLGVLWALTQHDIKRLLAYHSVENIGIILMGAGVGSLGLTYGVPAVAALGFGGALLHTVNHALFKSLLFLAAGAVYRATGTRDMELLGGVARRMPLTWLAFAVGAAAIIGVPPFNGFVSEWLVYQGMFAAADGTRSLLPTLAGIPALALIGALALACFAKVSGIVFLGTPRSARTAEAVERPGGYAPALVLALLCVALGVVPRLGVSLVDAAVHQVAGRMGTAMPASTLNGMTSISFMALALVAAAGALWWARTALVGRNGVAHGPTWACGYEAVTPRMQYTASSFAAPLVALFGGVAGVHVDRGAGAVQVHASDVVLDGAALPSWRLAQRIASRLRATQQGRLHVYLLYVLAALLGLLTYLTLARY